MDRSPSGEPEIFVWHVHVALSCRKGKTWFRFVRDNARFPSLTSMQRAAAALPSSPRCTWARERPRRTIAEERWPVSQQSIRAVKWRRLMTPFRGGGVRARRGHFPPQASGARASARLPSYQLHPFRAPTKISFELDPSRSPPQVERHRSASNRMGSIDLADDEPLLEQPAAAGWGQRHALHRPPVVFALDARFERLGSCVHGEDRAAALPSRPKEEPTATSASSPRSPSLPKACSRARGGLT